MFYRHGGHTDIQTNRQIHLQTFSQINTTRQLDIQLDENIARLEYRKIDRQNYIQTGKKVDRQNWIRIWMDFVMLALIYLPDNLS